MRVPIRTLKQLGADALLVTNAAGSLRAEVGPGRLMAIADHINLLGVNPLTGPNDDAVGPRFPSLRDAYDPELRYRLPTARGAARSTSPRASISPPPARPSRRGPRSARSARSVRMRSGCLPVPEVILARHAGLRVVAVSAITNLAEGMGGEELSRRARTPAQR